MASAQVNRRARPAGPLRISSRISPSRRCRYSSAASRSRQPVECSLTSRICLPTRTVPRAWNTLPRLRMLSILHSPNQFLVQLLGRESCPAIAFEQLQTVLLEAAPYAALAVAPLVVQAVGHLAERDQALDHAASARSSFASAASPTSYARIRSGCCLRSSKPESSASSNLASSSHRFAQSNASSARRL